MYLKGGTRVALPNRTIQGIIEISTGSLVLTKRPPAYTGEALALDIELDLVNNGSAYSPSGNITAEMYLYWPGTVLMTSAVALTITGSKLTGSIPETMMAKSGCPLLVIRLDDPDNEAVIVAAATPIQITNVLGEAVISTRPPTPSEIISIGRAPYINTNTGTWMEWDADAGAYADTEVDAYGKPASFTASATTLAAGSAATASITGTPENPVLNLGIPRGADGAVMSVNGKTGAVQLNDEDIPSTAVSGQTTVEGALGSLDTSVGSLNGQIANLGATCWEVVVENNQFVLNWYGATAESPITLALEGADYVAYIND